MSDSTISRRKFVVASAATVGAITMGDRLAAARPIGANDRINFGVIGTGGMGTGHVNALVGRGEADNLRCVAVCDVYQKRVTNAQKVCKGEGYLDYRRLLERNDIDAVLIATPDHWHAKLSMDAMQAGKHVYCEKPLTHTVEQAIALRDAVRRHKKVLQVGPQGTGDDSYWKAREAIQAGRIGKPTWAHGSYNRNAKVDLFNLHPEPVDPKAGPQATGDNFIDWDMWLGHKWGLAPRIPYNAEHFFHFRKFFPYNGGVATDLIYHKLAPLLIALSGPNGEYPLRVNANGGLYIEKDGRDIPDTFLMTVDYPSEYSVFLVSTLTNDAGIPDRIYGKYGTLDLGGGVTLRANGEMGEEFKAKNEGKTEVRLEGKQRRDMVGNFVDVIRGKDNTLHCNVELGAATMVAIKMAVESYRQHKTLAWDAKKEKMVRA